jgi:ABC-type dipeptide/oligopeptide/nickel transport system permease subunit
VNISKGPAEDCQFSKRRESKMKGKSKLEIVTICLLVVLFTFASVAFAKDPKPPKGGHPPGLVDFVNDLIQEGLAQHHQELSFSLKPGESHSFDLPEVQGPVRVEVSFSLLNGGTQLPSEIMYAVVNKDPESGQMTWVGTNNDGTQKGSNSLAGTQIAFIFGGASSTVNAVLEVDDLEAGALKISQSSATTSVTGHYIVKLWY